MAVEFNSFNFVSADTADDTIAILKQNDSISISTQNKNANKCGCIVVMELDEIGRLKDWLNKEFPNA